MKIYVFDEPMHQYMRCQVDMKTTKSMDHKWYIKFN